MADYGFVYVLGNPSMPRIYKVGFTRGSPHARAESLYSGVTGLPTPFHVIMYGEVQYPAEAEKNLHTVLDTHRLTRDREFFKDCELAIYDWFSDNDYIVAVAHCELHWFVEASEEFRRWAAKPREAQRAARS